MRPKTPAELQLEALRKMKEEAALAPRRARPRPEAASDDVAPSIPRQAVPSKAPAFEIVEAAPRSPKPRAKRGANHTLLVSEEMWQRLRERERMNKEFKGKAELGDWAAELLLALPKNSHRLNEEARQELFARMAAWARARGLH